MSERGERGQCERSEEAAALAAIAGEDSRLPYEPPRLTKKRSVARATLLTAMGPTMTGLTMMG
jgi:hypothetical protein